MSTLTPEEALRLAAEGVQQGNLAWAEALCHGVLAHDPRHAVALNVLGVIAMQVGMHDFAIERFRLAAEAQPNWDVPAKNLTMLKSALASGQIIPPTPAPGEHYVLIKSGAHGFWSDVDHVLGGLMLAEMTGRTPVVHWGVNSLFRASDTDNAWDLFFEPLSSVRIDELAQPGLIHFPPKWSAANLRQEDIGRWQGPYSRQTGLNFIARPENVIVSDFHLSIAGLIPWVRPGHPLHGKTALALYRELIARYLKPRPTVVDAVESFHRRHLAGGDFVAVHYRGADKGREQRDLARINQSYFEHVDRLADRSQKIFLLTDAQEAVDRFRARYGQRIVVTESERSADEQGVHLRAGGDGVRRGMEVLIDSYVAARASRLIGNGGSNVSAIVYHLKQWDDRDVVLLAPVRQHRIRPFLFRPV